MKENGKNKKDLEKAKITLVNFENLDEINKILCENINKLESSETNPIEKSECLNLKEKIIKNIQKIKDLEKNNSKVIFNENLESENIKFNEIISKK